ncbi:MAG TPA: type II toxin-antitoxin system HicA family toxin [Thermoanaerobaculia bacterium]|nr:type II toxin-antitoxin system HicA family toxin [Thermoanaerobaculia bacterium]
MRRRDLEHHLRACGCELIREGSKHGIWVNRSNQLVSTVPRHREVKNALARKICKDLGVRDPFNS